LLLVSGNDAAVALAEHCAGSVEEFADLMNARVRQLGGYDSHFTNPHGLPDPEHYTTAYDLSLITRQALRNPILAQIVASRSETIPRTGGDGQQFLANRNRMLWSYPGADGVKTGYTRAAGRCLVSSATRAGRQVIAVVLGSAAIWDDSRTVLDFGFEAFDYCQLVAREEIVREIAVAGVVEPVPLAARQGLVLPMWQGEQAAWEQNIQIAEGIKAPLRAGQVLGQFQVSHRTTGNVVAVDLIVTKDVFRRPGLLTRAVRCFLGVWEGLYDRLPRRPVPNLG
jgi:D-alanyl-D-alanine carboxypeptidase